MRIEEMKRQQPLFEDIVPAYCQCGGLRQSIDDLTRQMMAVPVSFLETKQTHEIAEHVQQMWYDVCEHQHIPVDSMFVKYAEPCAVLSYYNECAALLQRRHNQFEEAKRALKQARLARRQAEEIKAASPKLF